MTTLRQALRIARGEALAARAMGQIYTRDIELDNGRTIEIRHMAATERGSYLFGAWYWAYAPTRADDRPRQHRLLR